MGPAHNATHVIDCESDWECWSTRAPYNVPTLQVCKDKIHSFPLCVWIFRQNSVLHYYQHISIGRAGKSADYDDDDDDDHNLCSIILGRARARRVKHNPNVFSCWIIFEQIIIYYCLHAWHCTGFLLKHNLMSCLTISHDIARTLCRIIVFLKVVWQKNNVRITHHQTGCRC